MFENQAKGWHGSYSAVGKNSAEKYPMILIKDKILKDQVEKKQIKDYFNTDDEIENNKIIIDDGEDIFSPASIRRKKKIKKKFVEVCEHQSKEKVPEEYKFHQLHHKELFDYNLRMKKQRYDASSNVLVPKKDITWRRTVTAPHWDTVTGRDYNSNYIKTTENTGKLFYIDHNSFKDGNKTFQMDKQTKRGQLPISYDLRIRIEEPFNKDNNKKNIKINRFSDSEMEESSKIDKSKIFSTSTPKKDYYKKENNLVNFAKNLSREQYNYLHRDRRGVRPFFNPNYKLVEERSLSMVTYNKKKKDKLKDRRINGLESNLFFEPYKFMDKVNNHKTSNAPNLRTMVGRDNNNNSKDNIHLPGYMIQIFNRNSLEILTEKGLKMNNYINADFANDYTTFCNKKSFNKIINHNLLKGNKGIKNSNFDEIKKKFNEKRKIKRLMEFYTINLDNQNIGNSSSKFDGITYKTIKNQVKLSDKEKKLFSLKFDNE